MWTIREVKEKGHILRNVNYWKMVLTALILMVTLGETVLITGVRAAGAGTSLESSYTVNWPSALLIPPVVGLIATIVLAAAWVKIAIRYFLLHPLEVGCRRYMVVAHSEGAAASLGELFHCFSKSFLNVVKIMFLRDLYTMLWSLLFVIPGIVKSYSYRLVPFILAEEPGMASSEAFRLSREMMQGNKWHAFLFDLSFIGWHILNACTLGILGIFYVNPYYHCAGTELYITLRDQYLKKDAEQ